MIPYCRRSKEKSGWKIGLCFEGLCKPVTLSSQASAPLKTLKQFALGDLRLPPPQVYELGRLLNFVSYEDLEKFARERDKKGMELIFPVLMPTSDGLLNVLPGEQSALCWQCLLLDAPQSYQLSIKKKRMLKWWILIHEICLLRILK